MFDLLYLNGQSLLDTPYQARCEALERVAGQLQLVLRLLPRTSEEGRVFADAAYREGHEGVMVKELGSRYTPGRRGKAWFKFKHVLSLDLVIAAADWGYGRRHGWLSNYYLAARDADTGRYLPVAKTFKGLTDSEFEEMTRCLLALEQSRQGGTVFVQPQIVVEVLFNELQASRQYESGLALRFARIHRLREDKAAGDADTIQTLRYLYEQQFQHKGRLGTVGS
jgi:DNA ligase-1